MNILQLTTTEAVRGALGETDDKGIPDSYFKDSDVSLELSLHLKEWLPDYTSIISSGASASATSDQADALSRLKLYAKYYCADLASKSANFMLSQMESDGENEFQRYQDNKLEKLIDSLHRKMATHRASLVAYAVSVFGRSTEVQTYTQFTKATPSSDPVTGETT